MGEREPKSTLGVRELALLKNRALALSETRERQGQVKIQVKLTLKKS